MSPKPALTKRSLSGSNPTPSSVTSRRTPLPFVSRTKNAVGMCMAHRVDDGLGRYAHERLLGDVRNLSGLEIEGDSAR